MCLGEAAPSRWPPTSLLSDWLTLIKPTVKANSKSCFVCFLKSNLQVFISWFVDCQGHIWRCSSTNFVGPCKVEQVHQWFFWVHGLQIARFSCDHLKLEPKWSLLDYGRHHFGQEIRLLLISWRSFLKTRHGKSPNLQPNDPNLQQVCGFTRLTFGCRRQGGKCRQQYGHGGLWRKIFESKMTYGKHECTYTANFIQFLSKLD